jgi:hypothetical protein
LASIEEVMWLRLIVAVSLVGISLIPGAARSGGHSGGAGHGGGSPEAGAAGVAGAAASGMSGGGLALMSVAASGSYIFAGCDPCARALPKLLTPARPQVSVH